MTVSYQYDVASSTSGGFTRLLFKWQGSLYKLIHGELLLFCSCYAVMSAIYRLLFTENQKRVFEQVAFYCDTYMNYIPLSFILGFYVSFVASRWWQQYMAIPWPDKILHAIALHVNGFDEKGRMLRRSLVRYLNLSLVLVLRSISSAVKKRFPTIEHLVEAGFMSSEELNLFNMVPNKEFNTYWIPCTWFTALIREARSQKRLPDASGSKLIMEEFSEFRQKCGMLWSFDWVSIPLVYTQVVTIATYSFFMAAVVGRQFVEKSPNPYKKMIDLYVPFFTLLQFFFYMGLLKVAEQLINPFGDDDEDFELNWIIDRHMKVSYLIVDTLMLRVPPLTKDIFFDEESPSLPYTEASAVFKKKTYRGSVADMVVPEYQHTLILPDIVEEEDEAEESNSDSVSKLFGSMFDSGNPDSSKDGRCLSVPEVSNAPFSFAAPSRSGSFRSSPTSRPRNRRPCAAGSKGISNALMFLGSNKAVAGADSTPLGDRGTEEPDLSLSSVLREGGKQNPEDDPECLFYPFGDVFLDIEDINFGSSTDSSARIRDKGVSWMPASLQAKFAMKKKPVIKWKPYHRPVAQESTLSSELEAEGVFEDECAFMWRTIDDETESLKTVNSIPLLRNDAKDILSGSDINGKGMSHYSEIKPRSTSVEVDELDINSKLRCSKSIDDKLNIKSLRHKRNRYRTKGRTRHVNRDSRYFSSLPYIPVCKCGGRAISSKLLKSISEASIFLEAVTSKVQSLRESQENFSATNNFQIGSSSSSKEKESSCL